MSLDISNVTLPAIITSGSSSIPKKEYIKVPETFSELYIGKLPKPFILELAACYLSADGKSLSTIMKIKKAFTDFCEFSVLQKILSVNDINPITILSFREFMKRIHPGSSWITYYTPLRSCLSNKLPHIVWPPSRIDWNHTLGHSPYAYRAMLEALRQEIDRIRGKLNRFDNAAQIGRVLTFEDIKESIGISGNIKVTSEQIDQLLIDLTESDYTLKELAVKYRIDPTTVANYKKKILSGCKIKTKSKPLSFSKEDLIATISYYLPFWPVEGRTEYREKRYKVYREPKGRECKYFCVNGFFTFNFKTIGYLT
jgi:hypothetical protein